jgi:predicted glycoside hydrolase/deacetylase ChbG (UPF0249 family)
MKKITLCADDYGQNESISQAIIALLKKNRLSATSCMTTSSNWPSHAKWLMPFATQADIGLHFNLTEGKPLSEKLAQSHGFLPLSQLLVKAYWRMLNAHALEAELHAQLDAFQIALGRMPDFIDGHQHIHQLPVIRDVLLKVYEERLRPTKCYVRCVDDPKVYVRLYNRNYFKRLMIQLLGASIFKKNIIKRDIPHNSSFAGIYQFADSKNYSRIFPRFLSEIRDGGIIMCHPGLLSQDETDGIAKARYHEFLYLENHKFVLDCFEAGVVLGRLAV